MMKTNRYSILAAALACGIGAAAAQAAVVQATFNDLATGQLNAASGGTGFAAGSTWTGGASSTMQVVAVDLTAPASTNFALTQSGNARSIEARSGTVAERQRNRALETSMTGTIWMSFIVNVATATDTAGVGFNTGAGNNTFNLFPSLLAVGSDLVYDPDRGNAVAGDEKVIAGGAITLGSDTLILARLVIDGVSDPTLSAWVNPDASQSLPSPTLTVPNVGVVNSTLNGFNSITSLVRLSVGGTPTNASSGGNIDFLTTSNNAAAYTDVTGQVVPEPASLGLLTLGGLVLRRRRRLPTT